MGGVRGGRGVGSGWEAESGLNHPLAVRKSCVFSKAQKQPQCTCQDKMVAWSSLTMNAACESRPGHL